MNSVHLKNVLKQTLQLTVLCFLAACSNKVTFPAIDSFNQIQAEFQSSNEQTLVVFDVDGVLTGHTERSMFLLYQPEEIDQQDAVFVKQARTTYEKYMQSKDKQLFADMSSSILLKSKDVLVDQSVLSLINQLQQRGVTVIACTALPAGAYGTVACGRILRFEKLKNLGIDFSGACKQEQIIFDALKPYNGDYPMFYKGILFTNWNNDKGTVIGAFLDHLAWQPSKVLFFDDHEFHLEEVTHEMRKRGIPLQAYWCRAFHNMIRKLPRPPFDRTIAQIQLDYLLKNDVFLTLDEATQLAKKHSAKKSTPTESYKKQTYPRNL